MNKCLKKRLNKMLKKIIIMKSFPVFLDNKIYYILRHNKNQFAMNWYLGNCRNSENIRRPEEANEIHRNIDPTSAQLANKLKYLAAFSIFTTRTWSLIESSDCTVDESLTDVALMDMRKITCSRFQGCSCFHFRRIRSTRVYISIWYIGVR